MKKLRVTVDGKTYEVVVEVLDEGGRPGALPQTSPVLQQTSVAPPASSAPKPAATPVAGSGSVTSPLAGRVVSVDCKVGQSVAAGDQLVTIEAMKMNTFVYAGGAGTVGAILVNAGDAVEEGQVLVTIA